MSKFNINDAVFGSGEYYGFNEKSITLPYLSSGCTFSVTVNGVSVSVAYSTSLSNTLSLIKTALLAVSGVSDVVINGISPITISILSSVDGAILEITDTSLVCNGNPIYCVDVIEVSPLKEKACINICEPIEATIDLAPLVDAIKEKKDYELVVLCDAATGNPVIQTYTFDDSGLLVQTNINPDGSLFLGTVGKCPNKNYGITSKQWFCLSGIDTISREDIVDFETNTTVGVLWRDMSGAILPAPTIGTYTIGVCSLERIFISDDEIAINDATPIQLAVPANANLAEIQPQGCDVRYRFLLPVTSGKVIGNYTRLELESLSEIQNFNAIALSGQSGVVHIDYFFEPNLYNN